MTLAVQVENQPDRAKPRRRICFVTAEFHGLFRNGGIGTANTGLALTLADSGFDVTVAYADPDQRGPRAKANDFADLRSEYARRGVLLDFVPPDPALPSSFSDPRSASYSIFLYLQRNSFDVVFFNDNGAQGFYSLEAKHSGVFVDAPEMYVVAHGPFDWVHQLNALEYYNRLPLTVSFMERRCAELADRLISPSEYLVDWMREEGWKLPRKTSVIQNIVPIAEDLLRPHRSLKSGPIREIVFFGRQEIRKGLELFCDAIEEVQRAVDLSEVTVTILGKFGHIAGLHSGVYLVERARSWRASLRILANLDQSDALKYLSRPRTIAVIPSFAENSPCVVVECLELGLPFLATDSGGTAELVAKEDRARCLFPPDAAALASRLRDSLLSGLAPARIAVPRADTIEHWLDLLLPAAGSSVAVKNHDVKKAQPVDEPYVSVCLVQPRIASDACITSVASQTYSNIETVLVEPEDTGGVSLQSSGIDNLRRLRAHTPTRAAARNAAAREARGTYLLFVDEATVVLSPDCVAELVAAAQRTGSDIVTCFAPPPTEWPTRNGSTTAPPYPVGGCLDLGVVENCFGGSVILISAAAFARGAGFPLDCEEAVLDWIFLASATIAGLRATIVPLRLFTLREQTGKRLSAGDIVRGRRRVMRAYGDQPASLLAKLIEPLHEMRIKNADHVAGALNRAGSTIREMALKLSALDPNTKDVEKPFLDYCCERRMIDLAIDFALWNRVGLLPDAVVVANRAKAAEALEWVGRRQLEAPRTVDATEALRGNLRAVAPMRKADLHFPSEALVAHPFGSDVQIIKAAAGCPPGTRAVVARAKIDPLAGAAASVAIAVLESHGRLTLSDDGSVVADAAAWSDWTIADAAGGVEVSVQLEAPSEGLLDLYFLTRADRNAEALQGIVTWKSAEIVIGLGGDATASAVVRQTQYSPLGLDAMRAAVLLTDTSDFPYPVLVPGLRTLVHPLQGRPTLVRLKRALPAQALGLRCIVSTEHAESRPVDFGFWIGNPLSETPTLSDLSACTAFSGWMTVKAPFVKQYFTAWLGSPAEEAQDIYLAVRITDQGSVDFCHAYWHDLMIAEPGDYR